MQHTPFHVRSRETIYIGPERPRPRNPLGILGFVVSLVALVFTFGLLSPLGLLISSLAMYRRPRRLATAGVVLGLLPTLIWGLLVVGTISGVHQQRQRARIERQTAITESQLAEAWNAIDAFQREHDRLPSGIEGNKLAVLHEDAWQRPLRYEIYPDQIVIRSSGPDGDFESRDDILRNHQVGRAAIASIESLSVAYTTALSAR